MFEKETIITKPNAEERAVDEFNPLQNVTFQQAIVGFLYP